MCSHAQEWKQPHDERTSLEAGDEEEEEKEELRTVLTKPKILAIAIEWHDEYELSGRKRYVLSAADYRRLVDAVK